MSYSRKKETIESLTAYIEEREQRQAEAEQYQKALDLYNIEADKIHWKKREEANEIRTNKDNYRPKYILWGKKVLKPEAENKVFAIAQHYYLTNEIKIGILNNIHDGHLLICKDHFGRVCIEINLYDDVYPERDTDVSWINPKADHSYNGQTKRLKDKLAGMKRGKTRAADKRAKLQVSTDEKRAGAQAIKKQLKRGDCPYCGKSITEGHADHIYPVSKGGLSTVQNMVYICSGCNLSKSDKTLSKWIKEKGLDRDLIESRLEALKKEY